MKNKHDKYYQYLKNRSVLGFLYRKFILYPKLNKRLQGKILDLGCGIGDFLRYNKNAVGVDVNENAVNDLKNQGLNVFHMDYDVLPFDNGKFDSIVLDNVLEHISNPEPLLLEAHRVLKKNGLILIGVPGIY